ncbi:DUF2164 domain-containing protein [Agrobacterium sp. ES01]|uniref:DUF2164 domain-containing protein n=1 Tax=Agrobacterium sp. ES01 TaxID=3420714 RepID=UPI003D0F7A49
MATLDFSPEELAETVARLQSHFREEFQLELGRFEMEELVAVFAGELSSHFYNRGLYDAQAAVMQKVDDINEAIYQLEMLGTDAN